MQNLKMVEFKPQVYNAADRVDNLPLQVLDLLRDWGMTAAGSGEQIYLVGGMVRDLLLERNTYDIDMIVDGQLKPIISKLAKKAGGRFSYNSRFGTGTIILENGLRVDLAQPRKESYNLPGALPGVKPAGLFDDLFRRDFTINTLLLDITPDGWGKVYDCFCGMKDLESGLLRVLHRESFLDDPTRIIRGIRLASGARLSFEKETSELLRDALNRGYPALSYYRILKEIKLLFELKTTERLFMLIKTFPIFQLLNLDLEQDEKILNKLDQLEVYLEYFKKKNYNIKDWLLRLTVFLDGVTEKEVSQWSLSAASKQILLSYSENEDLISFLDRVKDPVDLAKRLDRLEFEEIILILVRSDSKRIRNNIFYYIEELKDVKTLINGSDLLALGLEPGPEIKEILNHIYSARVRGIIETRQEELDFVKLLLEKKEVWSE